MKSAPVALALLALCAIASLAQGVAPHTAGKGTTASKTLAIVGVTVIVCTEDPPRPNSTVLIENDRITSIGDTGKIAVPAGARKLDGRGKFLIPGLWDMHVHVLHDSFRALFLAHGVTGVRHMFTFEDRFSFAGLSSPRHWRKVGARRSDFAPRLVMTDSMIDGSQPALPWVLRKHVYRAANAEEARKEVRACKKRGEDFVKVYPCLSRAAFLAVLDEARKQGLPVAGHVPHVINVGEAAEKGMRCIEHLSGVALACSSKEEILRSLLLRKLAVGAGEMDAATAWRTDHLACSSYDPAKAAKLFQRFVRHGTWHVPTLVEKHAWGQLGNACFTNDPRLASMPALVRKLWKVERTPEGISLPFYHTRFTDVELARIRRLVRKQMELVEAMHKAGVLLLAGTDTPNPYTFPGSGLHDELELLVEAGLSPLAALQTATRNPALFLGRQKELGTVEVGKLADLVLLEANPLVYIGNTRKISAVILGGQLIEKRLGKDADPTKRQEKSRRD